MANPSWRTFSAEVQAAFVALEAAEQPHAEAQPQPEARGSAWMQKMRTKRAKTRLLRNLERADVRHVASLQAGRPAWLRDGPSRGIQTIHGISSADQVQRNVHLGLAATRISVYAGHVNILV